MAFRMHLYQQCEHVSGFSLTIKDVGSYTKLSIYKAKNKSDRSTTNSALQILENSGFKLIYSIALKSDGLKMRTYAHKHSIVFGLKCTDFQADANMKIETCSMKEYIFQP